MIKLKHILNNLSENLQVLKEIDINKNFEISYVVNPDVKELQRVLIKAGYYIGKYGDKKDGVDGKYGPMTKAAHVAYKNKLSSKNFNQNRTKLSQQFVADVSNSDISKEYNFHKIPLGSNNYRSAQIPVTVGGKELLGTIIDDYGIKTIIRLNGDGRDSRHKSSHPYTSIQSEQQLANSKGVSFYKLSSTRDQDQVNSLLDSGNVLIHCAHGADRTGGNVGGYLYANGWGDTKKIWDYTTKYNGWKNLLKNGTFDSSYLKQAMKFGVKSIAHAKQLAGLK
jgi:hypothetical protein